MLFKDYAQKVKIRLKGINNFLLERVTEGLGDKAIKMITDRVVGSGTNFKGSGFSSYSDKWAKQRKKKGLQTGYKNFSYTGSMFSNFQEIERKKTRKGVAVTIGMPNSKENTKVAAHNEREGIQINGINENEVDKLIEDIEEQLIRYINAE